MICMSKGHVKGKNQKSKRPPNRKVLPYHFSHEDAVTITKCQLNYHQETATPLKANTKSEKYIQMIPSGNLT